MEKQKYSQAQLPFMGQKRRWNSEFKKHCVISKNATYS